MITKIILILLLAHFPFIQAQTVYIFSHGLNCNKSQAKKYRNVVTQNSSLSWVIQDPYISFDYPDAHTIGLFWSKTSLGQDNEIKALNHAYRQACTQSDQIVLLGMSRGAATILAFAGSKNTSKIKALVVESPFDSIKNVLSQKLQENNISWIPECIINTAPGIIFSKYNPDHLSPLDLAPHIDKELPILLIASLQDGIIPAKNTAKLYLTLIQSGHTHVYFALLNKGGHGALLNGPESERYLAITHAFYHKYNLSYDPKYAEKGAVLLGQCQPTSARIKEAFQQRKSFIILTNPSI